MNVHSTTATLSERSAGGVERRVLVLGATGPTGRELVLSGLRLGHQVTVFARTPEKLGMTDDHLHIVQGSFADRAGLRAAVAGQDAVLSALGTHVRGPTRELSEAAHAVVDAMSEAGVQRLIWMTAMGITETRGQIGPIFNLIVPRVKRHAFADKERQEAIIRASPLDWTILHTPMLTGGASTGKYRAGNSAVGGRLLPRISRADVAHFMFGELEARRHVRRLVPLSY